MNQAADPLSADPVSADPVSAGPVNGGPVNGDPFSDDRAEAAAESDGGAALRRWVSKRWVQIAFTAVVALGVGGAIGGTDDTGTDAPVERVVEVPATAEQEAELDQRESELDARRKELDARKVALDEREAAMAPVERVVEVPATAEQEAELDQRDRDLDARQEELDAREASLDERQAAITAGEQVAARSRISRDGMYLVGTDIVAGVYKALGSGSSCYYEVLSDTSGDFGSIVSNHFGNAFGLRQVVRDGQYFRVEDCGSWQREG